MRRLVVYGQRDARWAGRRLGTAGVGAESTIGGYGCYVTCFAMLATYYGRAMTPPEVNEELATRGRFVRGNLVTDDGLEAVAPGVEHVASLEYRDRAADLGRLRELLAEAGTSVVLEVDFNREWRDGVQTHFVVAVGCDGERVMVADPWYGGVADLTEHYGDDAGRAIQKLVVYRGPVVALETEEDEMSAEERAIVEKMAGLGADAGSIDGWMGKIGRAAEIGRVLKGTKRMPKVVRPLVEELVRLEG